MKLYIEADQLFKCETCYNERKGKCNAPWCDGGESYRPAWDKFKKVEALSKDKLDNILHKLGENIANAQEFAYVESSWNTCKHVDNDHYFGRILGYEGAIKLIEEEMKKDD